MPRTNRRSKSYRLSQRSSVNQQILNCNSDGDLNVKRNSWWKNLSDAKLQQSALTNSQLHPNSYNILNENSADSEHLKSKWWKDQSQNESIDFIGEAINNDEQPEKHISKSDSAINESEQLLVKKNIFSDKATTQKSRYSRAFILKNEELNRSEEEIKKVENEFQDSPKEKAPVELNKKRKKRKTIFSKKLAKRKFSDVFNVEDEKEENKNVNTDEASIVIETVEKNDNQVQHISQVDLTNEISNKKSIFKANFKNNKYSEAFVAINQSERHKVSESKETEESEILSYTKEAKKQDFSSIDTPSSKEIIDKQVKHIVNKLDPSNKNSKENSNESSNTEKLIKSRELQNISLEKEFANENLFKVKHTNKKYSEAFAFDKHESVQNLQEEKKANDTNFSTISSINESQINKPTLFRPKARRSLYVNKSKELSNIPFNSKMQGQKISSKRFSLRSLDSGISRFDDSLISSTKYNINFKESSESTESSEKSIKSKSQSNRDILPLSSSLINKDQHESLQTKDNEGNVEQIENDNSFDKTQQKTKKSDEEAIKEERLSRSNKNISKHSLKLNKLRSKTESEIMDSQDNVEQIENNASLDKIQQKAKEKPNEKSKSRSSTSETMENENVKQIKNDTSLDEIQQQTKKSYEEANKKERLSQLNKNSSKRSSKLNESRNRTAMETNDSEENVEQIENDKSNKNSLQEINEKSNKTRTEFAQISSNENKILEYEETNLSFRKLQSKSVVDEYKRQSTEEEKINRKSIKNSSKYSLKSNSRTISETINQIKDATILDKTHQQTKKSTEEAKQKKISQLNENKLRNSRSGTSSKSVDRRSDNNEENIIQTEQTFDDINEYEDLNDSYAESSVPSKKSYKKESVQNTDKNEKRNFSYFEFETVPYKSKSLLENMKKSQDFANEHQEDSIHNQMNTIEKRNFREFSQFEPEPKKTKTLLENIRMSQNASQTNETNVKQLKEKKEMLLKFVKKSEPVVHSHPSLNKITNYFAKLNKDRNLGVFPKVASKVNRIKKPICTARLVNGKTYSKKLFHGKNWCTQKFYKFLQNKMEQNFGEYTINKSEELMKYIVDAVYEINKSKNYPQRKVDNFKKELAKHNVISTTYDFYLFVAEYLPAEFRDTVVPCTRAHVSEPTVPYDHDKLFEKIVN